MFSLRRLQLAFRYALNPGGQTRRSRLSKAAYLNKRRETTEALRRYVTERDLVAAVERAICPEPVPSFKQRGRG